MTTAVSIAICSLNNADSLRRTLDSIAEIHLPDDIKVELILVDNGSTDHTMEVMQAFDHPEMASRALSEPRRGQCFARNTALDAAQGDIILFTDDDIRVPADWVERMAAPILAGTADAVAGGVTIAPHLRRPWMTPENTRILASTANLDPDHPPRLVGANMAFSRRVLDLVPWFDTELGPGALGLEDEVLFTRQLKEAGFTITSAFDVAVVHHFDPDRLQREAFVAAMKRVGESQAYMWHHWYHEDRTLLHVVAALCKTWLELQYNRLVHYYDGEPPAEGMPMWEQTLLKWFHQHRYTLTVRNHPRKYDYKGLVKKHAGAHSPHRPEPVSVVGRASQQPSET